MNGSNIEKLIAKLCPNGVKSVAVGEICSPVSAPRKLTKKSYIDEGLYPIVDQGQTFIAAYTDDDSCLVEEGEYVIFGDHTREVKYVDFPFAQGADGVKILKSHDCVLARFFYYALCNVNIPSRGYNRHWTIVRDIHIPVPPLEVQREIVAVLDRFTALEAELEAELEARRRQYQYYRDALLTFDNASVRWTTLGEIGKVSMCKRVFKNQTANEGDIPFYKIGTFGGEPNAFISRELYDEYKEKYSFPKQGDVLISAAGTIGRAIPYDGAEAYFQDSNIVLIDNDESQVTNEFLWHWYQVVTWSTDGGTIRRLYNENLRRTKVPVPSFEEQERIVTILDKFNALVNDLTSGLPAEIAARRKQYEYYRDRLLTFTECA